MATLLASNKRNKNKETKRRVTNSKSCTSQKKQKMEPIYDLCSSKDKVIKFIRGIVNKKIDTSKIDFDRLRYQIRYCLIRNDLDENTKLLLLNSLRIWNSHLTEFFWEVILDYLIQRKDSIELIKCLLKCGANPNAVCPCFNCDGCGDITLMNNLANYGSYGDSNMEIFYWFILYGADFQMCIKYNKCTPYACINIIDLLRSAEYEIKKTTKGVINMPKYNRVTRENKIKILNECTRGINRMKQEVILYSSCIIIVLHNIIFDYLMWNFLGASNKQ